MLQILPCDNFNDFKQYCTFNIGTRLDPIDVILVYRPPGSGKENDAKLVELVNIAERNTIVVGDFNMPGTDWESWKTTTKGRALMEAAQEERMSQLVNFLTHTKGNTLDILLTNCPEKVANVSNVGRLGKSDHVMILIEVEKERKLQTEKQIGLNWRKARFD